MDNWCIVKDAPDPNAAHAWINFICDPEVSLKDLAYHGYNTGIVGVQERGARQRVSSSSTWSSSPTRTSPRWTQGP